LRTTTQQRLTELSDEELAANFQGGDQSSVEVLIERYRSYTRAKTKAYFLFGATAEDVEQEGLIGLFKAARDYHADRQSSSSSFRIFAQLCITRQVITAIKTANRMKQQPLNNYVSISETAPEKEHSDTLADKLIAPGKRFDPAEHVLDVERMAEIRRSLVEQLTDLEVDVLRLYLDGCSYEEIGAHLCCHVKCVDNSLQRVKRKLGRHTQNWMPTPPDAP
jgi:RNA polymerase sporulation-specific sigma factor